MRCCSAHTELPDPFEAGQELGLHLARIKPVLILVFASVHYEAWSEVHEGLLAGLGSDQVRIIGGTGDGVYARAGVLDIGLCALGFHLDPGQTFAISTVMSAGATGAAGAAASVQEILRILPHPCLAISLLDGISCDGVLVADGLATLPCPVIGGMATDSVQNVISRIFVDDRILTDALVLVAFSGPIRFRTCAVSGWTPVGQPGRVDEAENRELRRINGLTAQEFVDRQFGRPVTDGELGIVPLALLDGAGGFSLRTFQSIDPLEGSFTNRANIPVGSQVQVADANQEDILNAVDAIATTLSEIPFTPRCILAISCCGRKEILGRNTIHEITRLLTPWAPDLPFIGFSSGGELGPLQADEDSGPGTLFHNVTLVAAVLGE